MTTSVIIKSTRPNHLAVKVEAVNPATGEENGYGIRVLGHGESAQFYVHSGSQLRISETSLDEVPQTDTRNYTVAEKMAGVPFNPGGSADVANCKEEFAACIQRMLTLRENSADAEVKRMASIAITEMQTAQMWAVKAITWKA